MTENSAIFNARHDAGSFHPHRQPAPTAQHCLTGGNGANWRTTRQLSGECRFEPTLIERAPALRQGGYIIDFWGLGFDVAEKMDLLPALKNDGYEIEEVRLVNEQGKRIGGFSARAFQSKTPSSSCSIAVRESPKIVLTLPPSDS
jgi:hypothetical protein